MDKKIVPIILGYNGNNENNDVIIIYNLFYNIYKSSSNWVEPKMYTNDTVTINNLIFIMKNYKDLVKPIFLIYFTGHSTKNGKLKFYNENITSIMLLKQINIHINNPYHIYFIIDSCFSKKFIINYIPFKISYITYMVSSMDDETSGTILMEYDDEVFDKYTITKTKHFIVSIFTYYFVKLVKIRNLNINEFDKIPSDKLWKMIAMKYKQNIYYEHFSQTL